MTTDADTIPMMVRQMRVESSGVVSLRLERPDGGAVHEWTPGAHLDLHLGAGTVRQYSLCGDPDDKTGYRVAVLHEAHGRGGSRHIHETLRPGDTVHVSPPRNNFEFLPSPRYLFVAGGIGITPLLAMIGEATRMGADWELHYGGRSRASMAFLDELSAHGERVQVVTEDVDGILDLNALLGEVRENTLVYACGPEGLLAALENVASAWPEGSIQLERFKAKEIPADTLAGDRPVRVVCERSGISTTVAADRTVLDALEEAGVDVPNSCREGICGTCETRVLCGTPDHRDSLLSSAEQESGTTMMICVSRARSDELVLDL
ncbi:MULTISPECIES: PDR/VanB family oxidoreductase [Rhodococcus]|uniref:PDR/VanB family oxidoreductase n=1 Tax=Rhodococcus oxybenzonivorans TaxID=1990687 RepID=A0AAE4V3N6_9NOCA|nr:MULTISPECIES: PDR/VanB family oxidoreductase [Rhodococcus]MDV7243091.1 PDR/VanB family oxidoreductase [Rhodococcus oxybenzonivorans]MDV7267702.1 PDR/VanB family oxidoreductase [Rhodococcus oxybenzonivorans]MDV7275495.1 PDR/VanB family oxidoreductase [Rhodococcus oxybenzonivorans]MDV7334650.1 PDR/VanB family oxidoreductase [Rhodococcus oxybenzonivorans]MDV7344804.1 PDR/VanB family oxidoreductase [Rhodococcus oxybenzonivorans]